MKTFIDHYQENADYVLRFIVGRININDAEDIAQEVWIYASKKFKTFDHKFEFRAWIINIAKYKINDYLRHKYSRLSTLERYLLHISVIGESSIGDRLYDIDLEEIISNLAQKLGNKYQIAFEEWRKHLVVFEAAKSLSQKLGVNLRTAQTQIRRSVAQIRKALLIQYPTITLK